MAGPLLSLQRAMGSLAERLILVHQKSNSAVSTAARYTLHLRACAMVHTVHNLAGKEVGCFGRLIHRFAFRGGMVPVAVGTAVADSVRQMYGLPQPLSIPNGIDTQRFWRPENRYLWRCRNGFSGEDVLVVSVGRLERQKNPSMLVNAIESIPNAKLLLVGQGRLRADLRDARGARNSLW
jgi:glycosyltransferase involved in cell wall biosynthesis